ncbi:MAG: hypothetical protein NW206_11145 [Hyphomonadaceae bacterium]|nr:hypothetical protein [Hyphomonadaceae bacterium]
MIGDIVERGVLTALGLAAFAAFFGYALYRDSWRWRLLAQSYAAATDARPLAQHWTNVVLEGAKFGWNNYAGVALLGYDNRGLFLRLLPPFSYLHPPLFFPYADIKLTQARWFLQDACAIELRESQGIRIIINTDAQRWIEGQCPGSLSQAG